MKNLNIHWKTVAVCIFAVILTVWAGSGMKAKAKQDYRAESARVSPQVREAAIGALGQIGVTRGQTLRIGLLVPGPHVVLEVTDCQGNTLMNANFNSGPPNTCSFFDLNADQLPQQEFDSTGRVELIATLTKADPGPPGNDTSTSFDFATAQVFDTVTAKTMFVLALAPFECFPPGHRCVINAQCCSGLCFDGRCQ
jgi:hypothetical protein